MSDSNAITNRQQSLSLKLYESVIVIGCGGIGAWAALDVALSGCAATLHLIDNDKVESTNLNRTPFTLMDVDNYKVDAIKNLILERRCDLIINTYRERTNATLKKAILDSINDITNCAVIDCRDDSISDFYDLNCPYYKAGYDGFSVTIDSNPRETPVWGRANGYQFTPSYICPAQLAACLVVNHLLTRAEGYCPQVYGTFDIRDILPAVTKQEENQ